ncbi:MAG: hypothetical protein SGILL_006775 [Bacillariaceae sp.]
MASSNENEGQAVPSSSLSSSPSSQASPSKLQSYKQATGRFKLICTFEAIFVSSSSSSPDTKETDIKTAKILKTLVANARSKRDPKFHTINLSNPKIDQYVTQNEAAVDVLKLIGFVENEDLTSGGGGAENSRTLSYSPSSTHEFQEGSRLESLLDEKLIKMQKVDISSPSVKQSKVTAKTKRIETEEARKQAVAMFREDRERQQERQERERNAAEAQPARIIEELQVTDLTGDGEVQEN